jgi:hypothetical protein
MAAPKSKTTKTFPKAAPAGKGANAITHERIEHDIAEFEKSGGKIEKLGTTNTLKKIR